MRLPNGREALARLALPLPLSVVPELLRAIAVAAEGAGYTQVAIELDGESTISGIPPGAEGSDT